MPGSSFADLIRGSGLVAEGDRGIVLVSGGADSVALLLGLLEMLGPERLTALHVNYGLRESAGADEQLVRDLCEDRGVPLLVHRAGAPEGNVQAWARSIRLDEGERVRRERGADWIAVGHNRTDQVETFLYRLVASPGVRPLLAMPPRSGYVIRPMLSIDRDEIRRLFGHLAEYAEDPTNLDPAYARNRIRLEVLPELEKINPSAEANIARTREELVEDEEALAAVARAAVESSRGEIGLPGTAIAAQPRAIRRRMIRQLAEEALGRPVAITRGLAAETVRLAAEPEGGSVDLGGGDRLLIEVGQVRIQPVGGMAGDSVPEPARVRLEAGTAAFGEWEIVSSLSTESEVRTEFGAPWLAFLDLDETTALIVQPGVQAADLIVRAWRSGDRIEPLGMSGSKALQDVFTDGLVPVSRRRTWPVLTLGEMVVWIPGLVRSRHVLVGGPDRAVLRIEAIPPFPT